MNKQFWCYVLNGVLVVDKATGKHLQAAQDANFNQRNCRGCPLIGECPHMKIYHAITTSLAILFGK